MGLCEADGSRGYSQTEIAVATKPIIKEDMKLDPDSLPNMLMFGGVGQVICELLSAEMIYCNKGLD